MAHFRSAALKILRRLSRRRRDQHERRRRKLSAYDTALGRPIDLEQRINACRTQYERATMLPYESRDLLALTAFVAHQSKGQKIQVADEERTRPYPGDAPEIVDLELFLAWRARGLPVETPAIRP